MRHICPAFGHLAAALLLACCAVVPALNGASRDAVQITSLPNDQIFVHKARKLQDRGQGVDWSSVNNRLLLSKRGVNQHFHVYSVSPEGFRLKCLTLSKERGTPRLHHGNASWYPDGEYFVFTSQNDGSSSYLRSAPGIGLNCNLWVGDKNGDEYWRLTDIPTSYTTSRGVVYPHFSTDGSKLVWAGNTGEYPPESLWGKRALYLANFDISPGRKPSLSDTQELQPGEQKDFYEAYGFSPDGNNIVFAGNLKRDQSVFGMDIYTMDIRNSTLQALTDSDEVWDEFASFSPDGKKLIWMSSAGQDIRHLSLGDTNWKRFLKSDLWIMDADGSDPKRLTFFNDIEAPEYVRVPGGAEHEGRRCFVGDSAWGPDGNRIAITLFYESRNFDVDGRVLVLELGAGPPEAAEQLQRPELRNQKPRLNSRPTAPRRGAGSPKGLTW